MDLRIIRFFIVSTSIGALIFGVGIVLINVDVLGPTKAELEDECTPMQMVKMAKGFLSDVWGFGILGAIASMVFYYLLLKYQLFFHHPDIWRILISILVGALIAFFLSVFDFRAYSTGIAPMCLRKAMGPLSLFWDYVDPIWHFIQNKIGNFWLIIMFPQLIICLIGVLIVRFYRWYRLHSYSIGS